MFIAGTERKVAEELYCIFERRYLPMWSVFLWISRRVNSIFSLLCACKLPSVTNYWSPPSISTSKVFHVTVHGDLFCSKQQCIFATLKRPETHKKDCYGRIVFELPNCKKRPLNTVVSVKGQFSFFGAS